MRFAAATIACRTEGYKTYNSINPFVVEAVSAYEAEAKALAMCRRMWPAAEGWNNHFAAVQPAELVVTDPETATFGPKGSKGNP